MARFKEERELLETEFHRLGFDKDSKWRISDINKEFELCNTYPRFLIVPSSFKDEDLESVAKFRYFRRIPTAVWRHKKNGCFIVRSSQPTVGWFGWFRNESDENLVQSYVNNTIALSESHLTANSIALKSTPETSRVRVTDYEQNSERKPISQVDDDNALSTTSKLDALNQSNNNGHHNGDSFLAPENTRSEHCKQVINNHNDCDSLPFDEHGSRHANLSNSVDLQETAMKTHITNHKSDINNHAATLINNISISALEETENATVSTVLGSCEKSIGYDYSSTKSNICSNNNKQTNTDDTTNFNESSTSYFPPPTFTNGNGTAALNPVNTPDNNLNPTAEKDPAVISSETTTTAATTNNNSTTITNSDCDNDSTASKMLIIDARSYTAAMANRAKGGGCECSEYYQRCEVHFMNLANIHSIRKSYHAIRSVCEAYSEQSNNWLSFLDNSRWLHHISGLLKSALLVVDTIDLEEKSTLIHCSDGWDRTAQLVALAEIMLDSHYRTFDGFKKLIQREWLDFGHKFADRCGSNTCNEDPNERCPVFLQWLDCVQQLQVQFPKEFEFNSAYLDKLNRHTYSNVFGTFSYNSSQERAQNEIGEKAACLWAYFDSCRSRYRNENYIKSDNILRPSFKVRDLHFWTEVYLPPIRNNLAISTATTASTSTQSTTTNTAITTIATSTPVQQQVIPTTAGNISGVDSSKCCDSLQMDGPTRTVCK